MKTRTEIAILSSLLIAGIAGCGPPAERLLNQQIDLMNQAAAAYENDADQAVLDSIGDRLKENGEKLQQLDLSSAEKKALADKYQSELKGASKRLMDASFKRMIDDGPAGGMPDFGFPPGFGRR